MDQRHRQRPSKDCVRLLTLVLLAIGIRLLYIDTQPTISHLASTDAWGYHRLALNLERGNGFSLNRQAPFVPDSVRTPLYPLFLLLVRRVLGPKPRAAALLQAMMDGVAVLLTYHLAVRLASALKLTSCRPSRRPETSPGSATGRHAGRAAALLYALNPVQVRQANELLTETLLSCLLLLCLCTLAAYVRLDRPTSGSSRQRLGDNAALLAVALGLWSAVAALCKPNVQYLPLLWLPAIFMLCQREHRWRNAALMGVTYLVLLSPWMVRNQAVFRRPFLSTAFQGNVSRVSAPAALLTARGHPQAVIPWSVDWESAFGEIVSQAAKRYRWAQPWETMTARARAQADRQVYRVAQEILVQHPFAWAASHLQGTLRYLEPQTYRTLYAAWTGQVWPPDILDDALIHALRAALQGDGQKAGQLIVQERWTRLTSLQRAIWWGMSGGLLLGTALAARGAWRLRRHPALLIAILGTVVYVLLLPGPIAYERFRVPVGGAILALAALSFASPSGSCYNRRQ